MCDFGIEDSATPRVIAPRTSYMSSITLDLDTEVSGIDPPVLSGLTQSMAIVVDEQTILYLGYSESSNHYLIKVHFILNPFIKHLSYHILCFFFDSIISVGLWLNSLTTRHCPLLSLLSIGAQDQTLSTVLWKLQRF